MAFSAGAAWDHLDTLAEEHSITVKPCRKRSEAEAFLSARLILVPVRMSPVNYLVGLHELGHIVSGVARRSHYEWVRACGANPDANDRETSSACEAAAWAWAFEHVSKAVLPRISPKAAESVFAMLGTYLTS